jgi:CHAT domain-containing protein
LLRVRISTKNFLQQGYYELEFDPLNPLILGNPIAGAGCVQQFSVLPGAEEEALNVAEIMNAEAFIGKDASRKIIENNISNTDFIYFATHGISNAENPMDESYLVIASDSSENCDFLTARQIQDLPLDEDIVVLSACQTALGMSHKAGTIGVSRAFLNAGAQNVIMSLWNIDDASTVEFMEIFIQELQKPTQFFPSQNLRNAILICKQNNLNPVHWGAFVSFGAPYHPDISVKLLIEK